MREQEYLVSLHQLNLIVNGGFLDQMEDSEEGGFWLSDPTNGFTHWIVWPEIASYESGWDDEQEY